MNIEARFVSLWHRLGAEGSPGQVFADLVKRYSEPHRAYHNLDHIQHGLQELDRVRKFTVSPDTIEFAWWFHDSVYDPVIRGGHNEFNSAQFSSEVCKQADLSPDFTELIWQMIMRTRHIRGRAEDWDTNTLTDIDLVILGESSERFDQYELDIREEFSMFSDSEFVEGRLAFLNSFLHRPRIYFTGAFHYKYGDKARANLERSMAKLLQIRSKLRSRR